MLFKCKMCGAALDIAPGQKIAKCRYCGTTQTLPEAGNEHIAELFSRANDLRRNNEFDEALSVYQDIISHEPNNPEARWGVCLCRYGIEYVDDIASGKKIPTCHRASPKTILDDPDYLAAIRNSDAVSKCVLEKEAKYIASVQQEIISISQKEKPYDVFISYKETDAAGNRTEDSVLAHDIYDRLTSEGYRVFFSRISLRDVVGSRYEPYIYAALMSAKAMIVVATSSAYLNSPWVKNEWARYLSFMKKRKDAFFIPCYKGIGISDLPGVFRPFQSIDLGSLGALQDLSAGLARMFGVKRDREIKPIQEPKKSKGESGVTAASLTKRAMVLIAKGNFEKAEEVLEEAFDADVEYAPAHLAQLLIDLKVRKISDLSELSYPFDDKEAYQDAFEYGDSDLRAKLKAANDEIRYRNKQHELENTYNRALEKFNRGDYSGAKSAFSVIPEYRDVQEYIKQCDFRPLKARYDAAASREEQAEKRMDVGMFDEPIHIFESLGDFLDSKDRAQKCRQKQEAVKIENTYRTWNPKYIDKAKKEWLFAAINSLQPISGYKDSANTVELCKRRIEFLNERAKKRKKRFALGSAILAGIAALAAGISLLTINVLIPNGTYSGAANLRASGDYDEAIAQFESLNGYGDSANQIVLTKGAKCFANGDYEQGISYVYEAGGAVDVTYDSNGGEPIEGNAIRKSKWIDQNTTRKGYTFVDWSIKDWKMDNYSFNLSLIANWSANRYSISYDLAGGQFNWPNPVYDYDVTTPSFSIPDPTRTGYTFAGWNGYKENESVVNLTVEPENAKDFALTATWSPNTYKITLDPRGGTVDPTIVYATFDSPVNLPVASREGYNFIGWFDGDAQFASGKWTTASDITLTAKWDLRSYSISYDLGGGIVSGNPTSYSIESPAITLKNPAKEGYTFLGWTGTGIVEPTLTAMVETGTTGNLTFTANWEPNKYIVYLNSNGGTVEKDQIEVTYDQNYVLPKATRTAYDFRGWFDGNTCLPSNGVWKRSENLSLTAKWYTIQYTVNYNLNGGTNAPSNPSFYDVEMSFTLANPQKRGYTFLGWTGSCGENLVINPVVELGTFGILSFTANWKANEYDVSFDVNGGDNPIASQRYTFDSEIVLPVPSKQYYQFAGWYYGDEVVENGLWKIDQNVELKAKWFLPLRQLILDPDGGDLGSASTVVEVEYGSNYTLPIPTPSETQNPFSGWYFGDTRITDETGQSLTKWDFIESVTCNVKAKYIKVIRTFDDLYYVLPKKRFADFELGNDLDLSGHSFPGIDFRGRLNGNGYTIKNRIATGSSFDGVAPGGLFRNLTNAVIYDLQLDNFDLSGSTNGALTQTADNCKILNVTVSSVIIRNNGGGLIGIATNGTIIDGCHVVSGQIGLSYAYYEVGGLVESLEDSSISRSSSSATVIGRHAGGLATCAFGTCNITNCVNYGSVSALSSVSALGNNFTASSGGIVGSIADGANLTIGHSINYGEINVTRVNAELYSSNKGAASGIVTAPCGWITPSEINSAAISLENVLNAGNVQPYSSTNTYGFAISNAKDGISELSFMGSLLYSVPSNSDAGKYAGTPCEEIQADNLGDEFYFEILGMDRDAWLLKGNQCRLIPIDVATYYGADII